MGTFQNAAKEFFQAFPDVKIKRLGLRYINNITHPDGNSLDWKKYLNTHIANSINVAGRSKERIVRALSHTVLKYDDFLLQFRYGIVNKDFPAIIKVPVFTLDYDAFVKGNIESNDIHDLLVKFHAEILGLFKNAIKGEFRKRVMGC